jgi:diaminohydroxyphosphoribosylaminopyrimidine deaminase/5-amino-6-(5-phosphoribosylamino)uracil reductase
MGSPLETMSASASSSTVRTTEADAVFMDRALELAARGLALTSPNPMVGTVLVRKGKIIGEGFHTYEGVRHAEIVALEAASEPLAENSGGLAGGLSGGLVRDLSGGLVGRAFRHDKKAVILSGVSTPEVQNARAATESDAARGATLYINLEPCCHKGRTGPCTNALILAGVKRVVAAMEDPNPAVAGRGFKHLRAAGIEVSTGLREAQARRLAESFAKWIVTRQPLVTLKSALTLDGQLVLPYARGRARPPLKNRWISSPESRAEVQHMRHASDALLTGIGTILGDDPLLTDRTGLPRRRKLLRVVLDSRLRLPLRSNLVRSAENDVLVFTRAEEDSPKARELRRAGVEIVRVAGRGEKPDLRAVIAELGRREMLSVLLEAGATLNSAALAAGIVDKMRVFLAPKIAGFQGVSAAPSGFQSACELQNVTMAQFGVDFAVEGYLRDVYRTR